MKKTVLASALLAGAHVHNRPCAMNQGGGHYEHPGFEGGPQSYEDEI